MPTLRGRSPAAGTHITPAAMSLAMAVVFVTCCPRDNDLVAALARESAAAHGVGLTYWFSWFGGGSAPGQYSILAPYVSVVLGVPMTAAIAPFAVTLLTCRAARGLASAAATVWIATVAAWLNSWSGRVPFGLGCAAMVLVCIGLRERRMVVLTAASLLAVLFSPVSGAFVVLGLLSTALADGSRRCIALVATILAGTALVLIGEVFGHPGPEPYGVTSSILTGAVLAAFLIARPNRAVTTIVVLTAVVAVVLATIPNGLGSNLNRIAWICLPALVIATARTSRKVAVVAVIPALAMSANSTIGGLIDSRQPAQSYGYYAELGTHLDSVQDLDNYRLEVVQDGSAHMSAYALLSHAALARGWETQSDRRYDSVLLSPTTLTGRSYRRWLDANAVGYVAFAKSTDHSDPEHRLIAQDRPGYLQQMWSDHNWVLFRVEHPTSITAPPNAVVEATQSTMTIRSRCTCRFLVRIHYSKYLVADPPAGSPTGATLRPAGLWTSIRTPVPGRYTLRGV
jgi:hypothetical protein